MRQVPRITFGGRISFDYLRRLEGAVEDAQRQAGARAPATSDKRQVDDATTGNVRPDQLFDPRAERAGAPIAVAGAGTFREVARETSTERVENPEDSSQYVDVERVDVVRLVADDGAALELHFDND